MNTEILVAIFASTGFWTVVNTLIQNLFTRKRNSEKTIEMLKEADIAILHDKIYRECKTALRDGEITADDYHNIDCLVKPYFALGGNGTGKKLWEDVQDLPIVDK